MVVRNSDDLLFLLCICKRHAKKVFLIAKKIKILDLNSFITRLINTGIQSRQDGGKV